MKTTLVLFALTFLVVISVPDKVSGQDIAMQAFELRMNGHADSALSILAKAVKQYPDSARIWFEYGRCYDWIKTENCTKFKHVYTVMSPRIKAARRCFRKAYKGDPDNGQYYYWAASNYGTLSLAAIYTPWEWVTVPFRFSKTSKLAKKSVLYEPMVPMYRFELVNFLHFGWIAGGNMKLARLHADTLNQQDPLYGIQAKELFSTTKEPYNSLEDLRNLSQKTPENSGVWVCLAKKYTRMMEKDSLYRDSAWYCYQRALQTDPGQEEAIVPFTRISIKAGKEDPMPYIEKYMGLRETGYAYYQAFGYKALANYWSLKGDKEKAREAQEMAEKLNPGNLSTYIKDLTPP
jgi:tetratricopeptide (TPR) repeat protein